MFGTGIEPGSGKPVVDDINSAPVDLRTKTDEGAGESADTEAAAQAAEEKATRKEEYLATGKTEEEFDAEEIRLDAEKNKTPEALAEEKRIADEAKVAEDAKVAEELRVKNEMRAELIKEMGFNSEQELKDKLNPTKPKTPEQIAADAQIYDISLAKYAVEQKVFTNDEWLAVNNMRKATDGNLVFQNFADEYKEANKYRTIEDTATGKPVADPVTGEEIKDKFDELYHIDSANKSLKEQGEKNLALKAKSIRGPLEQKFDDIKEIYDNEIAEKQAVPDFRKFMKEVLATSIPEKLEYGTGDDKVSFDLSKLDKEEFEQSLFKSGLAQREFKDFLEGKGTQEQRDRIAKEIRKELLFRNETEIAKENFKAGLSKGTKTAAPGAKAPFIDPAKREHKQTTVKVSAEDNAKVAKAFA